MLVILIVLSASFLLTHIVLSHGSVRRRLVGTMGEWPFRGLYSLISLATFGGASYIFWNNRQLGTALWELPRWLALGIGLPLGFAGIALMLLAFATPSPSGMMPAPTEPRGVLRITRHPMNMGIACLALAHVLANGSVGDVAYFGSLLVLGVAGPFHQERRLLKQKGESFREFLRQTSALPFVALVLRRTRLDWRDLSFP
ncbi:MAG: hypothetical protein GY906_19330, partial [bacterium]|nr:hypothetical protein [bacterium]